MNKESDKNKTNWGKMFRRFMIAFIVILLIITLVLLADSFSQTRPVYFLPDVIRHFTYLL